MHKKILNMNKNCITSDCAFYQNSKFSLKYLLIVKNKKLKIVHETINVLKNYLIIIIKNH